MAESNQMPVDRRVGWMAHSSNNSEAAAYLREESDSKLRLRRNVGPGEEHYAIRSRRGGLRLVSHLGMSYLPFIPRTLAIVFLVGVLSDCGQPALTAPTFPADIRAARGAIHRPTAFGSANNGVALEDFAASL